VRQETVRLREQAEKHRLRIEEEEPDMAKISSNPLSRGNLMTAGFIILVMAAIFRIKALSPVRDFVFGEGQ
jgi:hypothetical protein